MDEGLEFEDVELTETPDTNEVEKLDNWVGDKKYFQTGKKAGQLKPKYKTEETETTPEIKSDVKDDSTSIEDEINNMNTEYATVEMPTVEDAPQRSLISGYMLVMVCDALIPSFVTFIHSKVKKGRKRIDSNKLRLTSQEREEMKELSGEAAKFLLLTMNPLSQFVIVMGAMYFGKIMEYEAED